MTELHNKRDKWSLVFASAAGERKVLSQITIESKTARVSFGPPIGQYSQLQLQSANVHRCLNMSFSVPSGDGGASFILQSSVWA